jgi:hypothetical protein
MEKCSNYTRRKIKMKKTRIAICALLLLCLLVCSTTQQVLAINVGSGIFCPNTYIPPPLGFDTPNEIALSTATCYSIKDLLSTEYQGGAYLVINCSTNGYKSILLMLKNYFDKAVVFSKGHRGQSGTTWYTNPKSTNHFSLMEHNPDGVGLIDYSNDYPDVWDCTSESKNTFTFIWHCMTAEKYPEGITPDYYGPYGMPYCWTHNDDPMNKYSDTGSTVYLGWVGQSYQFETTVRGAFDYADYAHHFWLFMCMGYTVEQTLNGLAYYITWQYPFVTSDLYDKLVVWGNWKMPLPSE